MKFLKLAGGSLNQTPMDWDRNLQHILDAIKEAQENEVALLCLPELAISGYGCEDAFFSDYVMDRSLASLQKIIHACDNITVSVGLPLTYENCIYNVCALIHNRELLGFVAKQELAGDGVHYEPRWFKTWQENLVVTYRWGSSEYPLGDMIFEIEGIRIGFEICEDAWNGVRPAEDHYLRNVDVILNPSASHFAFGKTKTRQRLVAETSRAYFCTYVYSNLLGNESGRIVYDGEIIIAQGGNIFALNERFGFENHQIVSCILELEGQRRQKKKSFNFQPELVTNLIRSKEPFRACATTKSYEITPLVSSPKSKEEEFYLCQTLALFDYVRKAWSNGFVISLSGGADSSACAVLAAHAFIRALKELGAEAFRKKLPHLNLDLDGNYMHKLVACAYQGTDNSGPETLQSAEGLANDLGLTFYNWNVQEIFDDYNKMIQGSLGRSLDWQKDDIALQNIQARLRAPGIWMIANIRNCILLTTSNRSEAAVGYATMDGDTAGGLAPLGGIDKAFLRKWLVWAQESLSIDGLKYVNDLQPTAELRPKEMDQTDEKDLMPYPILDKIEKKAIRDYQSPVEVFYSLRGLVPDPQLKAYITKFFKLWSRNQWKRERYAPSFHLDDENLDPKSWCRFPILSGGFKASLEELSNL